MDDHQHEQPQDVASDAAPESAAAAPEPDSDNDPLRDALGEMRAEADRIAELGTGEEQVEAAERFAEDAGRMDEQIGAAARAADDDHQR